MLVQAVVRHGEMTIYRNVETEDGGTIDLNVAQYISYDLGADGLSFHSEEYNRILAEAVEHSADADFKAEAYFTRHPDIGISTIAAEMAADRFQLSKSMQVQEDEDSLRNRVVHMVLDFRMDYVKTRLGRLREEMALAASDMEKLMPLMKEYTEVQNLRNRIAKELGNEIIV